MTKFIIASLFSFIYAILTIILSVGKIMKEVIDLITRYIGIYLLVSLFVSSNHTYAQPTECPDPDTLEAVPIEKIHEVEKALRILVPIAYEVGEFPELYSEWKVVSLKPFPQTVGKKEDQDYYGMAKNFCGKEVADQSWLVRLHFPKVKAASGSQGQIFVAKKEGRGWSVWFKYH